MNTRLMAIAFFLGGLSLTACQQGGGEVSPTSRNFHQGGPFGFTAKKSNMKDVGAEEMAAMLKCDEPSTSIRYDNEKMKVSLQVTSRGKSYPTEPTKYETKTWSEFTSDGGKTYQLSFSTTEAGYNGESALPLGTMAYRYSCVQGETCMKIENRTITRPSNHHLEYLLTYEDRMGEAEVRARQKIQPLTGLASMGCHLENDPDAKKIETTVSQGTTTFAGESYPAVKIVSQEIKKVVCGPENTEMGPALQKMSEVIIGDKLPMPNIQNVPSMQFAQTGCARTRIYSASTTTWRNMIFKSNEQAITAYNLESEVLTVEEYEESKENYKKSLAELSQQIISAENDYEEAKSKLAVAEAEVAESERVMAEKLDEFNEATKNKNSVEANPEATDEEKAAAVQTEKETKEAYDISVRNNGLAEQVLTNRKTAKIAAENRLRKLKQAKDDLIKAND